MGASNSAHTRTVTIDNESPIGVIDVSDAVVQRLKGGLSKGAFFYWLCNQNQILFVVNLKEKAPNQLKKAQHQVLIQIQHLCQQICTARSLP